MSQHFTSPEEERFNLVTSKVNSLQPEAIVLLRYLLSRSHPIDCGYALRAALPGLNADQQREVLDQLLGLTLITASVSARYSGPRLEVRSEFVVALRDYFNGPSHT